MSDQDTTRPARLSSRTAKRFGADDGMTTAEYAVGTVASCGLAGVLYTVLQSDTVTKLILKVLTKAFSLFF